MDFRRALLVLCVVSVATATASGQRTSVTGDRHRVIVTHDDATVFVESSMTGIGTLLARRGRVTAGDIRVDYDSGAGIYHIRSGNTLLVNIDRATGSYEIAVDDPAAATGVVAEGLDTVAALLRGMSQAPVLSGKERFELELSARQIEALDETWRASGLSQTQINTYHEALLEAEIALREAGDALREAREELHQSDRADARQRTPGAPATAELTCGGIEELNVSNRQIETDGVAIYANGTCTVRITNSTIISSTVAIHVSGSAYVTIEESTIEGGEAAMVLDANSTVDAGGTEFIGPIRSGNLTVFNDLGDNEFKR